MSESMADRGLKSAAVLGAAKPHGSRLRYMSGCRCDDCRRANTDYEKQRSIARKNGEWNGIVPATRARRHLNRLSRLGVGRRAVQAATDIADSILFKIKSGDRKNIRAQTERLILAVTPAAAGDHALIDAAPTWVLINELRAAGFTKTRLAAELGRKTHALQLNRHKVTVRNAADVERMHTRLMQGDEVLVDSTRARGLIRELRDEWISAARIAAALGSEAALEGGEVRIGKRISRRLEKLVIETHSRLMA